jgi:hypothetical protein
MQDAFPTASYTALVITRLASSHMAYRVESSHGTWPGRQSKLQQHITFSFKSWCTVLAVLSLANKHVVRAQATLRSQHNYRVHVGTYILVFISSHFLLFHVSQACLSFIAQTLNWHSPCGWPPLASQSHVTSRITA